MVFQTFFASRSRWIQAAAFALASAIALAAVGGGGGGAQVSVRSGVAMQPAASVSIETAPEIEAPIGAGWG